MSKEKDESPNSFYRFGGMDILTFEQDETSLLYKIRLSTDEHYVVSREFDMTKGMYGNAPEAVIRQGLMDFSADLYGEMLSIFDIMDKFIYRCFDDTVFTKYTEKAVWMSMDYPTYLEMEEILMTYNSRVVWFEKGKSNFGDCIDRMIYKGAEGSSRDIVLDGISDGLKSNNIKAIFMNNDKKIEKYLCDNRFCDMPIFKGVFDNSGIEFKGFKYFSR